MPKYFFRLLVDEIFSLADVRRQHFPAEYIKTIVRHCIGSHEPNPLCYAYRDLIPQLKAIVIPPTEWTKVSDFTEELEKKQKEVKKVFNLFK